MATMGLGRVAYAANKIGEARVRTETLEFRPAPHVKEGGGLRLVGLFQPSQSLVFFQNDFAGRIAQKVLQTGPALRDTVSGIIDGIWTLLIYVGGTISEENLLPLTATLAARDPDAVFLLDTPKAAPFNKHFLAAYKPGVVDEQWLREVESREAVDFESIRNNVETPPTSGQMMKRFGNSFR